MPSREELMQIVNQKIAEQTVAQISNEYQSNVQNAYEMAAAGRWDDAAYHAREARRLESEALPYVQAAQRAQPQSQYTEMEQELLRDYPQIARDPRKWQTALVAANNLIMRGYDRNSPEYAQAIAHACDVLNADLTESNEVASPNEAWRISQSKYGPTTIEEFNEGVKLLAERKRAGLYPMSQ